MSCIAAQKNLNVDSNEASDADTNELFSLSTAKNEFFLLQYLGGHVCLWRDEEDIHFLTSHNLFSFSPYHGERRHFFLFARKYVCDFMHTHLEFQASSSFP